MSIRCLTRLMCCLKLSAFVFGLIVLLLAVLNSSFVMSGFTDAQLTRATQGRRRQFLSSRQPGKRNLKQRTNEMVPSEVLVRLRDPISNERSKSLLKMLGPIYPPTKIGSVPNLYLIRSRTRSVSNLLRLLLPKRGDTILYVEPNFIIHADTPPDDASFSQQWGLLNTGTNLSQVVGVAGKDVSAVPGWNLFDSDSVGSPSIVVALLDTGVDYNHPDLMKNIWKAPTEYKVTVGNLEVLCSADTHGVNFVNTKACYPMDDSGHGTKVAGIIGAEGNNSIGIAGINWKTSIMPIKILDKNGDGTAAVAAQGIDFAIQVKRYFRDHGGGADVRILNNSYGWYANNCDCQSLLDQIDIANQEGMLFVASAGNDGVNTDNSPHYPSSYGAANVISVGAFGCDGKFAPFSNFGNFTVQLAAPGKDIFSTTPNGGFDFGDGTSFAAPYVSGAAALILAKCPQLPVISVRTGILSNVDSEPSWALPTPTLTGGRLNLLKALNACNQ